MALDDSPEVTAANAIIDLVRANPPPAGIQGDTAAGVMFGTYAQAFRRFVRIRDLARDEAGDEALILTRTLLSMTARAIWIDQPTDRAERRARFERWKKGELTEQLREAEGLTALGFEVEGNLDDLRAGLERLSHAGRMPGDRKLLKSLRMDAFYERLYRSASRQTHFSLDRVLEEVMTAIESREDLPLERGQPGPAREALALAILTYGLFLDMAERTVKHGLTERVVEIVGEAFPEFDAAT